MHHPQSSTAIQPETESQKKPVKASFFGWLVVVVHTKYRQAYVLPTIMLIVVLVGGSIFLYRMEHPSQAPRITLPAAVVFPQSWLIFQNLTGGPPPTNATVNIVRPDGTVLHQFSSTYADPLFDEYAGSTAAFSSGLLMSNQLNDGTTISVTKWSDLHADGTATPIPSILTGTLNNLWDSNDVVDGKLFLVGSNLLYGVFENSNSFNFQQINLTTGMVRTIFEINSLGGLGVHVSDVQPNGMNAEQTNISFVMNNVSINGQAIAAPSVVVYSPVTGTVRVTALPPRLSTVAPNDVTQAPMQYGLSPDGKLLAYQSSTQTAINDVIKATGFTTHVYNTQTGVDYALPGGMSIGLGSCLDSFYFSNDDTFLVTCGATSVTGNAVMEVANTTTKSIVKTISVGSANNFQIMPAGWVAPNVLVYTTNTKSDGEIFNAAAELTHSINLSTGGQHDFPRGLGRLLMVIH